MSHKKNAAGKRLAILMSSVLGAASATAAFAQDAAAPTAAEAAPSPNATINLINLLVKQGVLTQAQADQLISEAQREAAAAGGAASATAPAAAAGAAAAAAPTPLTGAAAAAPPPAAVSPDGTVNVQYVPESVKTELRDEIKQDVLAQAKQENWAQPNEIPDWIHRITLSGDIRLRYEGDFFPSTNVNALGSNDAANFNAINTASSPFLFGGPAQPPSFNVDQDRNRFRLRARFGLDANLGEGFSSGVRVATGENDSPVSENQSFGAANSTQGGQFAKYAIWLDRAYVKYEPWKDDKKDVSLTLGRFDNPFFATNLLWADDLGFDGAVLKGNYAVTNAVKPFLTLGAFPVFNTDFNFATNEAAKFTSEDKWLYAAQLGGDWKIYKDLSWKVGGAYYYFDNIQGKVSDCAVQDSTTICSTDDSRPSFAQRGNTYIALRNITNLATNGTNDFEFFGLATPFHEVAFTSELDYLHFNPLHILFDGEYVRNLAFDRNAIINNGPASLPGPLNNIANGTFNGGNQGYFISATVGKPALRERGDWNVSLGYKYLESDAVVDGFTDSDFGLGGTNLKGYLVAGNLALAPRIWTRIRWMSADNISGAPYSVDILQLDLNVRF
jgi:hypothetical protein